MNKLLILLLILAFAFAFMFFIHKRIKGGFIPLDLVYYTDPAYKPYNNAYLYRLEKNSKNIMIASTIINYYISLNTLTKEHYEAINMNALIKFNEDSKNANKRYIITSTGATEADLLIGLVGPYCPVRDYIQYITAFKLKNTTGKDQYEHMLNNIAESLNITVHLIDIRTQSRSTTTFNKDKERVLLVFQDGEPGPG